MPTATDLKLSGRVVTPGDAAWDASRQAFNLTLDQRPALIAYPNGTDDVAAIVEYAKAGGLRVAPQRTGHNAGPLGSLEDTILLKTSEMKGVEIDADDRRARVNAGAQWQDVVPKASELGLAALHGSAPDVGIVGYSLGGGVGWYARKHGLQSNSVTAIEVVTADGRLVRADHDNEPDLFWALRGGGGNFGVVTAIEFELYPIRQVYAGALFFPFERSSEVLHAWHEWTDAVPEEVTSVGRVLQFPPLPDIPEPLRGNSFVVVEAAYVGSEAGGAELLRPIRELGPQMDTFAMVTPAALSGLHMDPPEPVPYMSGAMLTRELPSKAIDDLVAVTGPGSGSPLLSVELRHTGGALSRTEQHHGALASVPGSFLMFAVGALMDESAAPALDAHLALVNDALEPHHAGLFLSFVERTVETEAVYDSGTFERLRAVRAQYDPDDLVRANHRIPPAPTRT